MNERKYLISRYFKKGYNLYNRMTEDFDDYMLFLRDLKVQPTNKMKYASAYTVDNTIQKC